MAQQTLVVGEGGLAVRTALNAMFAELYAAIGALGGTDAEVAALAAVTSAANKLFYFTGSGTGAVTDFTAAGRALVDDADAAAQRTTLGLVIGTDVQAYDAELAALAGLTSAANKLPYFTGSGAAALADITSLARTFIALSTAQLMRVAIDQGVTALTDGATINTDCSLGNVFTVTLGGNRTLANPTNKVSGAPYQWIITQDGTGSRTLSYGTDFDWVGTGGSAPTLSTTAAEVDVISGIYDGTKIRVGFAKGT